MRKSKSVKKAASPKTKAKAKGKAPAKKVAAKKKSLNQLSTKVSDELRNRTKTYAKANGLKIGALISKSLTAFIDAAEAQRA